jgi:hypothetical protein
MDPKELAVTDGIENTTKADFKAKYVERRSCKRKFFLWIVDTDTEVTKY